MKIVFPIGSFFPSQEGGPSNSVYLLAKELAKDESFEISVISTDKGVSDGAVTRNVWTRLDGINVVYIEQKRGWYLSWISTIYKTIRHADVVHLTSLFYPPSIIAFVVSTWMQKPVIWSIRGELNKDALNFGRRKKAAVTPLIVWLTKRNPYLTFHSTSDKERDEAENSFLKAHSIVIPNGIGGQTTTPKSSQDKEILFLGRLHPIKNIDLIICAFAKSTLPDKNYCLTIAGKGESKFEKHLNLLVQECKLESCVRFAGHVEGAAKSSLIQRADWLLLLSKSENFGNVVLESLQAATPVIVSKSTPWKEVPLFKAGFQVDATEEAICEVLNTISALPREQYMNYQRGALNLLIEHYNISSVAHQWKKVYEKTSNFGRHPNLQ